MKKFVIFSDTHGFHKDLVLPDGDFLICAGDICARSTMTDVTSFANWFLLQPHQYKILIPGNHDWPFERDWNLACSFFKAENVWVLHDGSINVEGFSIFGTAWQPFFCNWAYNIENPASLRAKYRRIPEGTDILITHCPPYGILDELEYPKGEHVGPKSLLDRVKEIKPKLHVFGHIHCGWGQYRADGTTFVNASICTEQYDPLNKPVVVELENSEKPK